MPTTPLHADPAADTTAPTRSVTSALRLARHVFAILAVCAVAAGPLLVLGLGAWVLASAHRWGFAAGVGTVGVAFACVVVSEVRRWWTNELRTSRH